MSAPLPDLFGLWNLLATRQGAARLLQASYLRGRQNGPARLRMVACDVRAAANRYGYALPLELAKVERLAARIPEPRTPAPRVQAGRKLAVPLSAADPARAPPERNGPPDEGRAAGNQERASRDSRAEQPGWQAESEQWNEFAAACGAAGWRFAGISPRGRAIWHRGASVAWVEPDAVEAGLLEAWDRMGDLEALHDRAWHGEGAP